MKIDSDPNFLPRVKVPMRRVRRVHYRERGANESFCHSTKKTAMTVTNISSSDPLATSDSSLRVATVVRPGEGRRVRAFGNEIEFMLSGEQTAESLTAGIATVPPGNGPPPHVHDLDDELFLILEGDYRFLVDGESTVVGPGALVYVPRGTVHTFRVVGETAGRHWTLQTPSGFERYFTRSSDLFAAAGRQAAPGRYARRSCPPVQARAPGAQ